MKKIKDFKFEKKEKRPCEACGAEKDFLSTIALKMIDANRCYKGSGHRGIIMNYKLRLCDKCFPKVGKKIKDIII